MASAVQLLAGQTRDFSRGNATATIPTMVRLPVGQALIINLGVNDTIFVKSGTRRVTRTRIINLKPGQTVVVKSVRTSS
ncbi:hypothetical protein AAC03nite_00870 [Alicyclobacillus acidoterrestris]|uniref:hypothetical protein n=1 Tax=Alicyclobacillus suci TaxID=2816080 RepID=UPI0011951F76|nr:hypothetical protein [Alicyclobacillus suci]GEO24302.1 hypothetical protein AAC03nite_00870 [Alicyclobacillus acidoterrestris]